jgi:hypothetical protein
VGPSKALRALSAPTILTLALHNNMQIKYILAILFIIAAYTVSAETFSTEEFLSKAIKAAKEKDYNSYKLLYCSEAPKTLGKLAYFENERKIFSRVTLHQKNTHHYNENFFGDVNYDYVLSLCSFTKETKEICMVQPVIKNNKHLCIINMP